MWIVYLLKNIDKNWYYVGSTNNIANRVTRHNKGLVKSTKFYRPLKLVCKIEFKTEKEARKYERKIKSQRKEKERIIKNLDFS